MSAKYRMRISRLTIDKLGVKLYDRVAAAMAELVANSYDADATEVTISAPMNQWLATKKQDSSLPLGYVLEDAGFTIKVSDNGIGMTPDEVNEFYLYVGKERRNDPKRGAKSRKLKRAVMGRKGVGKLAPFGICRRIEVLTSGGETVEGKDADGKFARGYLTAHLILDGDKILRDTEEEYLPEVGSLDGIVRPSSGTSITLSHFAHRSVPDLEDFARQMAQRFGIGSVDWSVKLVDETKPEGDANRERTVGAFDIETMEGSLIRFEMIKDAEGNEQHAAVSSDRNIMTDLSAAFTVDGKNYPVRGWMAYSRKNYKDDLMAGVRIYCHGKIAAQTSLFNRKSGFTGEFDIRAYLVGEIHADWLDEEEDLIQTDRRDILWSHEIGKGFETWGQGAVLKVGSITRNPMKKKTWERFEEVSKIKEEVNKRFPGNEQESLRDKALDIAKLIGSTMREGEVENADQVEQIVQLSLFLAPHVALNNKLREAAESRNSPIGVVTGILKAARVAELSSFGQIAYNRVQVIERLEQLKDAPNTTEDEFQKMIVESPWLVNPQWTPITENKSFSTLKKAFAKYYEEKTGTPLALDDFSKASKRPDFVMLSHDDYIQIVEIKKPHHPLGNDEMDRINNYYEMFREFLNKPANSAFQKIADKFIITLVCDELNLTGLANTAFEGLVSRKVLEHINWDSFWARTRGMHEEYLAESDRQAKIAAVAPKLIT